MVSERWKCGIVCFARVIAAAMALRISSIGEAGFSVGAASAGPAGFFAGLPWPSRSPMTMTPPGPVPRIVERSMPSSWARTRAAGEAATARGAGAGPDGAASADSSAGSGASQGSGASGGASPSLRTTASGAPTGRVWPRSATSSWTVPSSKISISMAPFWVSTTATISPRFTVSPGSTSHSTSLPASMSAPREGMLKTPISAPQHGFRRRNDLFGLGNGGVLEVLGIGDRHFLRADTADRRVERPEGLFHDPRGDLRRNRPRAPALVDDDRAAGLFDRCHDRGVVEGPERAQVDHLGLDAVLRKLLGGVERLEERAAVGDEAYIGTLAAHCRAVDIDGTRRLVDLAGHVVEHDVLENEHGVGVLERRPEHSARVLQRGRGEHLQPRDVPVPALETVGMLRGELLARAGGHPDDERHGELSGRHVPDRGRGVHDLVEGEKREIH